MKDFFEKKSQILIEFTNQKRHRTFSSSLIFSYYKVKFLIRRSLVFNHPIQKMEKQSDFSKRSFLRLISPPLASQMFQFNKLAKSKERKTSHRTCPDGDPWPQEFLAQCMSCTLVHWAQSTRQSKSRTKWSHLLFIFKIPACFLRHSFFFLARSKLLKIHFILPDPKKPKRDPFFALRPFVFFLHTLLFYKSQIGRREKDSRF